MSDVRLRYEAQSRKCLPNSTSSSTLEHNVMKRRRRPPRRKRILSPLLQSTLPNLKQSPPYPSMWTSRSRRLSQGWVLCQRSSCRWAPCVQLNEILRHSRSRSRAGNLGSAEALGTLRNYHGASIRPAACCTQGPPEFTSVGVCSSTRPSDILKLGKTGVFTRGCGHTSLSKQQLVVSRVSHLDTDFDRAAFLWS